jgi:hypothetical protein
MTVCGGWSIVKSDERGTTAITLWCRSWQCADCAPYRVSMLKRLAVDGQPTSFITLTVNPAHGQSPEERAQQLSDAWKIVVKRARRKWTKAPLEYFCVFEETKKGEPHLHILARAPYIPQKWLSMQMQELINAPVVDIRKVGRAINAARYVAKYVGKGPKAFPALKRYWQSSGWNLEKPKTERGADKPDTGWRIWQEPLVVIRDILSQWGRQAVWVTDHEVFLERLHAPPW